MNPLGNPLLVVSAITALAGCSGLSGLGGEASLSCPRTAGVNCRSMSEVYEGAVRGALPSQRALQFKPSDPASAAQFLVQTSAESPQPTVLRPTPVSMPTPDGRGDIGSGVSPLRSETQVMRVWVAPWEDADGDLHDQQFVYITVEAGRWLIEHARRAIRHGYAPIRAPAGAQGPPSDTDSKPVNGAQTFGSAPGPQSRFVPGNMPEFVREAVSNDLDSAKDGR